MPVLPRLTQKQYYNSILELFGPGLPAPGLEADTNPYLFYTIGAATTTLSEAGTEQYEQAADLITHAVFDDPARRVALTGCEPTAPGDACVAGFLNATFGRRVYRRPLTVEEQGRWLTVATDLAEGDPWRGVQLMVAGLLQSPHFLYRVELGVVDPMDPARRRYTGWEMASRMSFLLWDRDPGRRAAAGGRAGAARRPRRGWRVEAERLLADPRANAAMSDFFTQFLDLGRLDGVTRDPARYPLFTPTMISSMRTEIQLRVEDLINRRDADVRRLFSSRETFVNSDLAALYGIVAEGATPVTFVPATLPEDGPRAGILTSGAFLTMNAHETATSPTARGKYVRERVLCQPVPPPPDNIDTDLDDEMAEAKTTREKMELHRKDPAVRGLPPVHRSAGVPVRELRPDRGVPHARQRVPGRRVGRPRRQAAGQRAGPGGPAAGRRAGRRVHRDAAVPPREQPARPAARAHGAAGDRRGLRGGRLQVPRSDGADGHERGVPHGGRRGGGAVTVTRKILSRRMMLRGSVGGASVALALPLLDAMLTSRGALAEGPASEPIFGLFYWANGTPWHAGHGAVQAEGNTRPVDAATQGADFAASPLLAPIAAHRPSVATGLEPKTMVPPDPPGRRTGTCAAS
jgi:hypothetical protein